jgi:hypothetical protein
VRSKSQEKHKAQATQAAGPHALCQASNGSPSCLKEDYECLVTGRGKVPRVFMGVRVLPISSRLLEVDDFASIDTTHNHGGLSHSPFQIHHLLGEYYQMFVPQYACDTSFIRDFIGRLSAISSVSAGA